jgi:hypothetical protein
MHSLLDVRYVALALWAAAAGCAPSFAALTPTYNPALGAAPLRTVTVMPIDLTLDADDPPGTPSPEASYYGAVRAVSALGPAVSRLIAARGFHAEQLAWDGTAEYGGERRAVLDAVGVANLADWLLGWTYAVLANQASAQYDMFIPPLPLATDATLFVGGYGHLYRDRPHRAQVARDIAIGVGVALGIVFILLIALMSKGKLGFPHFGGVGGAVLRAITFPVVLGANLALAAPRAPVAVWLPTGHIHGPLCNPYVGVHAGVVVWAGRPRPQLADDQQRRANFLALGATLVENRTGRVLWTAAQPMGVDPVDEQEVELAVQHLLEQLPAPKP